MRHLCKRFGYILPAIFLLSVIPFSGAHALEPQEKVKAAFVYYGPIGDHGWTFAHELGRREMKKSLPYVETAFTESVKEGDVERIMIQYARKGYNLIFGTTYGYMDAMVNVAKRYPNVVFVHCSGFKVGNNLGTYWGRVYQPSYLAGIVAGKMTKTNVIGYVAAHPIPAVIRIFNAFTLGVQSVNPKAKVHLVWTYTWYDPAKEREAAESLFDINADVVGQYQDTPAVQQTAQKRGKYGIGQYTDMSAFAPKAFLTGPVLKWGVYYKKVAREVHNGTWKNYQYWGGLKDGVVGLAPFGPMVPQAVRDLVEQKKAEIISGTFDVFEGPVKDQNGKFRVPAGQRMSDKNMLGMNFLVEGVIGSLPK